MKRLSIILFVMTFFATMMSAQDTAVARYAYLGKFKKSKITVSLWFEENNNGVVSGEIVYTNSKQKTPMRVIGNVLVENGIKTYTLNEYQRHGRISGRMQISQKINSNAINGTWRNDDDPDKPTSYQMVLTPATFPQGKGGTLEYSSDPAGIYHYTHQHFWKGEIGGRVEIHNLKGDADKMRVSITKNDPHIAEYESHLYFDGGRLHGAIETCDLTFDIHVFKDFVWVINTSEGTGECSEFGAFTTLNGIYLKE